MISTKDAITTATWVYMVLAILYTIYLDSK